MSITTSNPHVRKYPQDTKDFLQKLEKVKDIPEDLESLYTNVPNNKDIKAVNESYEKYKEKAVPTEANFL